MPPKVSIGLPVYNGERYLRESARSLLAQTFDDFELILCDNASTDGTEAICCELASADRRVRYVRHDRNRGAAWNFNFAFAQARGQFFRWHAHDDLCEPTFLERCLEVFREDPSASLVYPNEVGIDAEGRPLGARPFRADATSPRPHNRFRQLLRINRGSPPIFGLMPSSVLRRTGLIGRYDGSDQVLLAELALHGAVHQVTEALLLHREHPMRSVHAFRTRLAATLWFDPSLRGRIVLPTWRMLAEYYRAIRRSPLGVAQKSACCLQLVWRIRQDWRRMAEDVVTAAALALWGGARRAPRAK